MEPIVKREHEEITLDELSARGLSLEHVLERISYDSDKLVPDRINMLQFGLFKGKPAFSTYFRIGAEWLDKESALVVLPKMEDIDYLSMFMACLRSKACAKTFSEIYDIQIEQKPIESEALNSVLSPLLLIHFLHSVEKIASVGLKKGYVSRSGNLAKVRGRINVRKNERINIRAGHPERVYCEYQEFSVDIPENRIIKKALGFARIMLDRMSKHRLQPQLKAILNKCLSVFESVSDEIEPWQISSVKVNKLYHNYEEAIRIARLILRRFDYSLQKASTVKAEVPPFCIDMSLLFEHYVFALLENAYRDSVQYQVPGYNGSFYADFLFNDGNTKAVIDSKYIPRFSEIKIDGEIVKQLSGYARSISILSKLGLHVKEDDAVPDVPCLIIFPEYGKKGVFNPFIGNPMTSFLHTPQKGIVRFYKASIPVPSIQP